MSFIIKGMDLPSKSERRKCSIAVVPNRPVSIAFSSTNAKPIECFECTEIATPHGRLIDADALIKDLQGLRELFPSSNLDYFGGVISLVKNSPTIIEAEVSE